MSVFVDECNLHVKAGDGGAGCASFRREAHTPMGGPDGGDGGNGGDVWVIADPQVSSLLGFRDHPFRRAESGRHGSGRMKHGPSGDSITVALPPGTVIYDQEGNVMVDLGTPGAKWLAGKGGQGGRGNARFLSNKFRAPAFAEQGEVGQETWYRMELKLMADVALVGFPNVGKSTLISRVSAAKPKIADYPFTTLEPNLGVVRPHAREAFEYVVADIPGLIEGASEGKGLGHKFLRHIERAKVLVLLLDLSELAPCSPLEQQATLLNELGSYHPELLDRPRIVVGSRCDIGNQPFDGLHVSGITGEGLTELTQLMSHAVAGERKAVEVPVEFIIHRPMVEGFHVKRDDTGAFVVVGRAAERAIALNDVTSSAAMAFVQHRLDKLGVGKALIRAGCHDGDLVRIGEFAFEWVSDDNVIRRTGRRRGGDMSAEIVRSVDE